MVWIYATLWIWYHRFWSCISRDRCIFLYQQRIFTRSVPGSRKRRHVHQVIRFVSFLVKFNVKLSKDISMDRNISIDIYHVGYQNFHCQVVIWIEWYAQAKFSQNQRNSRTVSKPGKRVRWVPRERSQYLPTAISRNGSDGVALQAQDYLRRVLVVRFHQPITYRRQRDKPTKNMLREQYRASQANKNICYADITEALNAWDRVKNRAVSHDCDQTLAVHL